MLPSTTPLPPATSHPLLPWPLRPQHDAGVRNVATIPEMGAIVSVGWDRALRVFDLRAGKCVHVIQLAAKPHAMDAAKDLIVVAEGQIKSGSGRGHKGYAGAVELFNLRSLPRPERQMESPLRMQTRCVRVFPDATSFVIGSVEGRCGFRLRDRESPALRPAPPAQPPPAARFRRPAVRARTNART